MYITTRSHSSTNAPCAPFVRSLGSLSEVVVKGKTGRFLGKTKPTMEKGVTTVGKNKSERDKGIIRKRDSEPCSSLRLP